MAEQNFTIKRVIGSANRDTIAAAGRRPFLASSASRSLAYDLSCQQTLRFFKITCPGLVLDRDH